MRRPFKLTIEEALEGESEVITSEPLTETELEQNAEETAELNAEIEQDSGDVEATLEEVDALEEQAAATDEVLAATADEETGGEGGEPVADEASAITEEQVVNAEESFKWSLARLGGATKYEAVVTLAKEHKASGLSRRARLKVCNEGVKETIARLIQSIINIAKQIASRVVLFVKRNLAKFVNYKKQIEENGKIIAKLDAASVNADDLAKTLAGSPSVEMALVLETSSVAPMLTVAEKKKVLAAAVDASVKAICANLVSNIKAAPSDDTKAIDAGKFADLANKAKDDVTEALSAGKLFGLSANGVKDITGLSVVCAAGKTAYGIKDGGTSLEKVTLDFASNFGEGVKLDIAKLASSFAGSAAKMGKLSADLKPISDIVVKIQKDVETNLKKVESTAKVEGFGNAKALRAVKGAGIDLSMCIFNSYLACIKTYVRVGSALAAYGTKKSK